MEGWRIENDAAAVLALGRGAERPVSPTDGEAGLRQLLRHDPDSLLLVEADGAVVGSMIAAWDGWRGEERLRGLGAIRPRRRC